MYGQIDNFEFVEVINSRNEKKWDKFIFIDDAEDVATQINGYDVFSYAKAIECFGDALDVIIAIGEPVIRQKLYDKLVADNIHMPTLINPDSYVSKTAVIGEGTVIRYGSSIFANAKLGKNVCVNPHANIGHDVQIGDGTMISALCNIAGAVHIGEYSYIGMNTAVRELVSIGNHSVVSMGMIISDDVPDHALAIGNPVRLIRIGETFRVFKKSKSNH